MDDVEEVTRMPTLVGETAWLGGDAEMIFGEAGP
jgi:hypothetical protein